MKIEITTEKIEAGYLMKVKGDVDMNTSSDVRSAFAEIFRQAAPGMRVLLIDLSRVRYMDSSGIATLVEVMQNCMKKGARLRLFELSPPVRDVFEIARLTSIFEIFPSMNEAQAGL